MKNTENPSLWEHWVGPSFERFRDAVRDITNELNKQQRAYKKSLDDRQKKHARVLNEQQQYFMLQQEETLRNTKYQQELKLDLLGGFHYGGAKIENGVYSSSDEILTLKLNVESTRKEQELQSALLKLHSKLLNELAIGNQDAIADLRNMIEQNERETSMLKQKCTEFSQSLDSAKKYFEISFDKSDAKLKEYENLGLKLNQIIKDVLEYKLLVQSKEKRISHLENVIKSMDMKIEDYEHKRIKAHEELKEIQDDIISLKIDAAEKHHVLESILNTLDRLKPLLAEMQKQQFQAQQLTEIYQDPYERNFYNHFVQQLNAIWLASAVVNTDIVAFSKTGITANIGNTLDLLAGYLPLVGGAVKLCGMLLVKIDSKIQEEKVNNLYKLVTSPLAIDNVAKKIAVDLLKSLEIDVNKLDSPKTLLDKLYNILGIAIDNIEKIINFAESDEQTRERTLLTQGGNLLLKTAASILQGAINRDQESPEILLGKEGKKHAEIVATIIIAKIYNGEALLAENANMDEEKATILEELLLDEYGFIPEDIAIQARIIADDIIAKGKEQLQVSESKCLEREENFAEKVSEVLLSKLYYRKLLKKTIEDERILDSMHELRNFQNPSIISDATIESNHSELKEDIILRIAGLLTKEKVFQISKKRVKEFEINKNFEKHTSLFMYKIKEMIACALNSNDFRAIIASSFHINEAIDISTTNMLLNEVSIVDTPQTLGNNMQVLYFNSIKYDSNNILLYKEELLYEAGKIGGVEAINQLLDLGKDQEIAEQILLAVDAFGIDKVLEIFFGDKLKISESEPVQFTEQKVLDYSDRDKNPSEIISSLAVTSADIENRHIKSYCSEGGSYRLKQHSSLNAKSRLYKTEESNVIELGQCVTEHLLNIPVTLCTDHNNYMLSIQPNYLPVTAEINVQLDTEELLSSISNDPSKALTWGQRIKQNEMHDDICRNR